MEPTAPNEHVDVLIVGAGLSGVGAGYHLQRNCPAKRFVILEGRDCIGGTWDLFRYPGIRSDSDMFTMGYSFKPWTEPKAIADGPRILNYVRETAAENGIDKKIRFNHRVKRASSSSHAAAFAGLCGLAPGAGSARQQIAAQSAGETRLSSDSLAQRVLGHVFLPAQPAQAGAGQATDPRRRQDGARSRLRHRHPFHAALQPVGSAAVPGA